MFANEALANLFVLKHFHVNTSEQKETKKAALLIHGQAKEGLEGLFVFKIALARDRLAEFPKYVQDVFAFWTRTELSGQSHRR